MIQRWLLPRMVMLRSARMPFLGTSALHERACTPRHATPHRHQLQPLSQQQHTLMINVKMIRPPPCASPSLPAPAASLSYDAHPAL